MPAGDGVFSKFRNGDDHVMVLYNIQRQIVKVGRSENIGFEYKILVTLSLLINVTTINFLFGKAM